MFKQRQVSLNSFSHIELSEMFCIYPGYLCAILKYFFTLKHLSVTNTQKTKEFCKKTKTTQKIVTSNKTKKGFLRRGKTELNTFWIFIVILFILSKCWCFTRDKGQVRLPSEIFNKCFKHWLCLHIIMETSVLILKTMGSTEDSNMSRHAPKTFQNFWVYICNRILFQEHLQSM